MKVLNMKFSSCEKCPYCRFFENAGEGYDCEYPESKVGIIVDIEESYTKINWPPIPKECPLQDEDMWKKMYVITKEQVVELERIFRASSFVQMYYDDQQHVSRGLIILKNVQETSCVEEIVGERK